MTYTLFLDDERDPKDITWLPYMFADWIIVRSVAEAKNYIEHFGMPYFISFDHDLGKQAETGYDLVKQLIAWDMDNTYTFPDNFAYRVHSKNPIGSANIKGLLSQYLYQKHITSKDKTNG